MELFQPQVTLSLEKNGDYTLTALTFVPTNAWSAGRARVGVPANVRVTPETLAVLLPLHARSGPALQVITPVRHRLGRLAIGMAHGKTRVTAFTLLHQQVLGSASVEVGPGEPLPSPVVDTSDWYAWFNRMPPGPASFRVTGTVYLPTPGYRAELKAAAPQGINPAELILDLVLTPLPGFWPEVVTPTSVRLDLENFAAAYTGVLVREPDGDSVHFEVDEVF